MAVPASLVVSAGLLVVSAASYGSARLAYHVTFILSFVFLERVLSTEIVDGFFREVDAAVLGDLLRVRDFIRDKPLTAPIYAAAEERARRARAFVAGLNYSLEREAEATLSSFKGTAAAALLWLRLAAGVANLAATVVTNAALEEARSRAPQVLRWRGVKGLRASPPNEEGSESAPEPSKKSTTFLVLWIAAIVAYCAQVVTAGAVCSSIATFRMCFPCFAALCGFALMEAERVYLWGSYAIDTTGANPGRDASGGGGVREKDLKEAWWFLWFRVMAMHGVDAYLVAHMLGWRPFVLASLAIYNLAGLNEARQVYLTAADDDTVGPHGNVSRWRRAVLKVLTLDIAKVVATYIAIDYYLGAMLFVSLCWKATQLLKWAIFLSADRATGDDDSNQEGAGTSETVAVDAEGSNSNDQEGAGLAEEVAGDAQGSDDAKDVAGDAHGCEDDGQEGAAVAGDVVAGDHEENSSDIVASGHEEEEGSTTEEHSDVSDSKEEHSDVSDSEEPRREESDSSSSSSSMDGWSFVGDDPIVPTDVNTGVYRKFRFF